ncbi:TIGR03986 family CRISPR-associated RAMP protein [Saccharopolyspora sp. HNM0986]|nr:TIGR03986 family CRISPR-associated RAMP protein [Saccharopolyspora sp. HNM0986]
MTDRFINPYTFVPFPEKPPMRAEPHGHLGNPRLLSGKLTITITAGTPLLIRGYGTKNADGEPSNELPRRPDGTAFVPGSSLKGAVRSLHETLTGSCLRVFDADFLPSYRDVVASRRHRRMAVVAQPPAGDAPPAVCLCEPGDPQKFRLDQELLEHLHLAGGLRSGQRLQIPRWNSKSGRPDQATRDDDGEWVVFLSDPGARDPRHPYRAHVRKLARDQKRDVPEHVWSEFLRVVQDTDDQRTAQLNKTDGQRTEPIVYTHKPDKNEPGRQYAVGERHLARPDLQQGQPVWVDLDDRGRIEHVGLAMNWRNLGGHSAGERAAGFLPCDRPDQLCPSCRLFGSIDPTGTEEDERAAQRAYRGHVRFGDAVAKHDVVPKSLSLPPMGAPSPGAGQFYLTNDPANIGRYEDTPLREWGASPDEPTPRKLRGRKHYWHTDRLNGREAARQHQTNEKLISSAEAFPADTELSATITFVDIDEQQLGGLIAALEPSALLEDEQLRTHLGGGKPLGYGACRVAIDPKASEVHFSGARYGLSAPERDIIEEKSLLLKTFRESVEPAVRDVWNALARVLRPQDDPEQVWYPPGADWSQRGTKDFDDGFEFWQQTSGAETTPDRDRDAGKQRNGRPLRTLPFAEEADQSIPIVKKGEDRS